MSVSQFFMPHSVSLILPERLDWPCNLTFTIICGIYPRVAILFLINNKKELHSPALCPWAKILSHSTSQQEKLSSLVVGCHWKTAVLARHFSWSQRLHCCLWLTMTCIWLAKHLAIYHSVHPPQQLQAHCIPENSIAHSHIISGRAGGTRRQVFQALNSGDTVLLPELSVSNPEPSDRSWKMKQLSRG